MDINKKNRGALPMFQLTFPLAMEQIFRVLVSAVDTLMLSNYSNSAAAGVAVTSQYVFFLNLIFSVIATGCSIVLSQYIGAQKSKDELNHIAQAGAVMMLIVSAVITVAVIFGTAPILSLYDLEPEVRSSAIKYFVIFGGICCFFNGFSLLQASILRTYGYTKEAMITSIVANLVNVFGNAISIYGWFGLPVTGVNGVAWSSGISMIVSFFLFIYFIKRHRDVQFTFKGISKVPLESYKKVLSVGIPTAGESLSYNISQILIMKMITKLGTNAITAQNYTQTIMRFVFAIAVSIGNATQIKTGYYVGSRQTDIAYKKVIKYQLIATACSTSLVLLVNIFKNPIIGFFPNIPELRSFMRTLFTCCIYIEIGRTLNLVYVGALKGAGDIKFPVFYGIFSMWGIMVAGSLIFGLKLGFGLAAFYLCIGTDETTRGIVMFFRWKSKRWKKHALV